MGVLESFGTNGFNTILGGYTKSNIVEFIKSYNHEVSKSKEAINKIKEILNPFKEKPYAKHLPDIISNGLIEYSEKYLNLIDSIEGDLSFCIDSDINFDKNRMLMNISSCFSTINIHNAPFAKIKLVNGGFYISEFIDVEVKSFDDIEKTANDLIMIIGGLISLSKDLSISGNFELFRYLFKGYS